MNDGYSELDAVAGAIVEVSLDRQANVFLLDRSNYDSYRFDRGFRYHGGLAQRSPVRLVVPHTGHWYVVVDPQGGTVRHSVRVLHR